MSDHAGIQVCATRALARENLAQMSWLLSQHNQADLSSMSLYPFPAEGEGLGTTPQTLLHITGCMLAVVLTRKLQRKKEGECSIALLFIIMCNVEILGKSLCKYETKINFLIVILNDRSCTKFIKLAIMTILLIQVDTRNFTMITAVILTVYSFMLAECGIVNRHHHEIQCEGTV